ncbi:hypothetical protein F5Y01DRAFT_321120 [Xylaria sp. FL0043]|nr:hypothetical protein F5Y01DRAFT_321120 [Xylaria sp. FL0043]
MSSSISRLPDSATRFISSHVVIVSPALLVKELLDNAIDAKATSVEILISPDTISKVEVRDNGVGIHPDDFDALGRHDHTSKLRNIGELGSRVGESLGFRGEALASVNSVADVNITTKASVEPIATTLQLKPNEGGILTQKPASAPVGTTVIVTNLFRRQPVRRQVVAKEAKKTLDKIQDLLRAYIMARPHIKIMYKVLNTPTRAWSYSPKPNATVIEATLQLFGTEVTSNCHLKTSHGSYTSTSGDSSARLKTGTFLLQAFLANPEANLRNLPKFHYFSVDGRPLNASRGAAKRLLKIYLEYLRRSTMVKDISDCFIRLNISCPPNSYDANVEPSKDDVLFSNQEVIEDAFRSMCNEVYRPAAERDRNSLGTADSQANSLATTNPLSHNQFHQTPSSQIQPILPDHTPQIAQSSSQITADVPAEVSHYNMETHVRQASFVGNSTGEKLGKPQTSTLASFKPINPRGVPSYSNPRSSGNEPANPASASNLWKIDRSVDLDDHQEQSPQRKTREPTGSYVTEIDGERNIRDRLNPWAIAKKCGPTGTALDAKSKGASERSLTPEPPVLRHIMAPPGDLDVPGTHRDMERTKLPCLQRPPVPGGPYRSPMASPSNSKLQTTSVVPTNHSHTTRRRREHIPWTPPSSVEKQRFVDMPHIDSTRPPRADGLKQTQISFGGAPSGRRRGGTQSGGSQSTLPSGGLYSGLESNKDIPMQNMFSTAKKNLHYQLSQMGEVEAPENNHSGESHLHHQRPSRRRQPFNVLHTNTFGGGDVPQEARQPIPTTLPIGDPRAYLLRRQKSMAAAGNDAKATKLSRVKSSLMPFENSPPEYQTRVLSWTVGVDGSALEASVRKARKYDKYVIYGALVDRLDMSLSDGRAVESQLQNLLADQKENFGDGNAIVDINLQSTLKGKSVLDT